MRSIPTKSVGNLKQDMKKINRKKKWINIQTMLSVQLLIILLNLQL
jgi:ABC-type microcin C transport system permease subunit YejE